MALQPDDVDFEGAAIWQVVLPQDCFEGAREVFLCIDYTGDVGRAYLGDELIDDDFFFGRVWEIGLRRFAPAVLEKGLTLKILPLRRDAPVYIPEARRPRFDDRDAAVEIRSIHAEAEYEVAIPAPASPSSLHPSK